MPVRSVDDQQTGSSSRQTATAVLGLTRERAILFSLSLSFAD